MIDAFLVQVLGLREKGLSALAKSSCYFNSELAFHIAFGYEFERVREVYFVVVYPEIR